jgi:hypothetical protein
MPFPFVPSPTEWFNLTLDGQALRFRVNYPHVFPSQAALEQVARLAWQGEYDGLTQIAGGPPAEWMSSPRCLSFQAEIGFRGALEPKIGFGR